MNNYYKFLIVFLTMFLTFGVFAKGFKVSSSEEFNNALRKSSPGDEIIWLPGTYKDVLMNISKSGITLKAKTPGETIFTGMSWLHVSGSENTLEGFQFLDGDIGNENVIETTGNDNIFTQINISGYTSWKYLEIKDKSQRITVSYCNFENRINLDDKNILSIRVNEQKSGFHKIQYCSFKNFKGDGKDMGIEPIRIGVSSQKDYSSKSLVEYCYFTQCSGDGEIVSNKSADNVYRYNTFENNPVGELVLRHGDGAIVYGNFFINGKGGVRVKEGEKHIVFNNYFTGLTDTSIYLQNTKLDPVRNITIAHNTFIETARLRLNAKGGEYPPRRVRLINNLLINPSKSLVSQPTGGESWIGNIYFGKLGMDENDGLRKINPMLKKNDGGYYELSSRSPAINNSSNVWFAIPQETGLKIDDLLFMDIIKTPRPEAKELKDVGCQEYQSGAIMKPFVTENNTGPTYLMK